MRPDANGGYCVAPGNCASSGAQVTNGISPDEEATASRNSLASYVDVGFNPVPDWYVGTALRYEHYNQGVGATRSGKLDHPLRLHPTVRRCAPRLSNGFRAPSLANSLFSARSTTYGVVDGVYQSINYGALPIGSAAAKALGAQELKPERSTNFSLGFTLTPTDRLSFTADAYVINLRDRITLTGTLLGPQITQVLQGNGITSTSGGQYFINGADTRTKGLDLVSNYNQDLGAYGSLKWTAAFNWNRDQDPQLQGVHHDPRHLLRPDGSPGAQPDHRRTAEHQADPRRRLEHRALQPQPGPDPLRLLQGGQRLRRPQPRPGLQRPSGSPTSTLATTSPRTSTSPSAPRTCLTSTRKNKACPAAPWSAATAPLRPSVLPAVTTTPG